MNHRTRVQPLAEEPLEAEPQMRLVCSPGGIILSSAAQMHSTVANTSGFTRYSIDFRTVNIDDVVSMRGAPNIDSAIHRYFAARFSPCADCASISDEIVQSYNTRRPIMVHWCSDPLKGVTMVIPVPGPP